MVGSAGRAGRAPEDPLPETDRPPSADRPAPTGTPTERHALHWLAAGTVVGLLIAAFGLARTAPPDPTTLPDDAIARVGDVTLPRADFLLLVEGLESELSRPLREDERRHALDRMIEEELLVQRALDLGLARLDRRVRADLTRALITHVVADAEDRVPDEDELARFFEENRGFFGRPPRLRVQVLFFGAGEDSATRAARARELVAAGEPFPVVRAGTGDPAPLPLPDALLSPAKLRDYLGPAATERAAALRVGETSEPLPLLGGTALLHLAERETPPPPELAALRPQVEREWRRRQGDRALRSYLEELRQQIPVVAPEELP